MRAAALPGRPTNDFSIASSRFVTDLEGHASRRSAALATRALADMPERFPRPGAPELVGPDCGAAQRRDAPLHVALMP